MDVPTEFHSTIELLASVPQAQLEIGKILIVKGKKSSSDIGYIEALPLSMFNPDSDGNSLDVSQLMYDATPRFLATSRNSRRRSSSAVLILRSRAGSIFTQRRATQTRWILR